jgi:hypothetical protein
MAKYTCRHCTFESEARGDAMKHVTETHDTHQVWFHPSTGGYQVVNEWMGPPSQANAASAAREHPESSLAN